MSEHDEALRVAIEAAVLDYVRRNPQASDTADGIRVWWLAGLGSGLRPALVESVLEAAAMNGRLRRLTLPDGSVLYAAAGARPARAET
ncbi:MAG: hypothetical protein NVS9B10_30910 [Nevskia sp.]